MTTSLILPIVFLIAGLGLLVWSSDFFVDGAASTAIQFKVSPLIIGVVIIGFGTSAPELVVSTIASLNGNPSLAIGNAIGSNTVNIGLVLGATALIAPIMVKSSVLRRELPILLAVTIFASILIIDYELGIFDGLVLLATLAGVLYWLIKTNQQETCAAPSDQLSKEVCQELAEIPKISKTRGFVYMFGGIILLVIAARMMVYGAVEIAEFFQVPDLVIGLTIVAIGTSLPELAASITAALKDEADLMIGNILGSNLFNLLAVLSVPALLAPSKIDTQVLLRDYPIMLGFTLAMLLVALPRKGKNSISKLEGLLLLSLFIGYLTLLYLGS